MSDQTYWWLNANPKMWRFSDLQIGEEQDYTLYNENGHQRKIFQNFLDVRAEDIVIVYETSPKQKVVGIAQITKENDGQKIYFKKIESLTSPIEYQRLKGCPELANMEFFQRSQGSLFKLKKQEFDFIMKIIRKDNSIKQADDAVQKEGNEYTEQDFLSQVYMSKDRYNILKTLLWNKKNIILQGAPGVGKTFTAKRLAYSMIGNKDDTRIEMIQFHQSYSYEDFIMGFRPTEEGGFKLKHGIFYEFCQKAAGDSSNAYFFIIDEINRGNLSKIFGELLMLIEKGYRGKKIKLACSGEAFSVPENLYIIGMMNTADRSIAMIDYALRRRFSFFDMEPGFDSEEFRKYQDDLNSLVFNELIEKIKELNRDIENDKSLRSGCKIGHSYFCGRTEKDCTPEWMKSVVQFDIIPMLEEYWFDETDKLSEWKNKLLGVFE